MRKARGKYKMARERFLTVQEVADQLNVHPDTVRKWIRSGELEALPLGGPAGYRITQSAVDKFIRDRMDKLKDQG
jgi:excisionase family DNA binding protein